MLSVQTIDEIRRERLEMLINAYGSIAALNEALGLTRTDSSLSQIRSKARHSKSGKPRAMGDPMARRLEEATGKPRGWMDTSTELERQAADPQTAHILALLVQLPDWQKDQVAKIVEAFAAPPVPPPAPGQPPQRKP